jgi:hypothetical protein
MGCTAGNVTGFLLGTGNVAVPAGTACKLRLRVRTIFITLTNCTACRAAGLSRAHCLCKMCTVCVQQAFLMYAAYVQTIVLYTASSTALPCRAVIACKACSASYCLLYCTSSLLQAVYRTAMYCLIWDIFWWLLCTAYCIAGPCGTNPVCDPRTAVHISHMTVLHCSAQCQRSQ